ncbi:conserved protein of unknown function [Clostridium beijerinckii]|nr:conserved protein of unknown function [Clostridium beijerinckii]
MFRNIYIAKIILYHNSKNIVRILAVIVNCEMCIVNCNMYIYKILYVLN